MRPWGGGRSQQPTHCQCGAGRERRELVGDGLEVHAPRAPGWQSAAAAAPAPRPASHDDLMGGGRGRERERERGLDADSKRSGREGQSGQHDEREWRGSCMHEPGASHRAAPRRARRSRGGRGRAPWPCPRTPWRRRRSTGVAQRPPRAPQHRLPRCPPRRLRGTWTRVHARPARAQRRRGGRRE